MEHHRLEFRTSTIRTCTIYIYTYITHIYIDIYIYRSIYIYTYIMYIYYMPIKFAVSILFVFSSFGTMSPNLIARCAQRSSRTPESCWMDWKLRRSAPLLNVGLKTLEDWKKDVPFETDVTGWVYWMGIWWVWSVGWDRRNLVGLEEFSGNVTTMGTWWNIPRWISNRSWL